MGLWSQTMVAGLVVCGCVFSTVIYGGSASALPAATSPPDKKTVEKDETIVRHKDIGSAKQEVTSSNNATGGSPREETKPKSKPVEGRPNVILNSVPGQLESILSVANRLEKQEKTPKADISRNNEAPPSDEHFLQDQEDEEEEAGEDLPEEEIYKRWQQFMNDPRLPNALEDNVDQKRSEMESKMNRDLYSPELVEYIARMDEVDLVLEDLVNAGKISPREAAWYRKVMDMEYGVALPPLPPVVDAETQPFVEIPDNTYDADDVYNGADNYIFQSDPPRYYSTDDDSQPPSADDRFIPGEEEEEDQEGAEESDYDNSKEREELLREFLGLMSRQDNDQEPLAITSAENKSQKPNHPPVPPGSFQPNVAVEKELESLRVQSNANKTPEVKGTEEEVQLEEVRSRKPKQDNRTKLTANGQNQLKKKPK